MGRTEFPTLMTHLSWRAKKGLQLGNYTNLSSVIPSDYCYNRINEDPSSFKFLVFELTSDNKYKWLGLDYRYSGSIH